MATNVLENPFPPASYHGPEYFCDRDEETKKLISNLRNGNSTTLFAIRRIGKTALIQHTLHKLPQNWKGIYVDILETENLNQFLNKLTTSILNVVPEKSKTGKQLWSFIKSLRPVISFDSLSGIPQASFDIKPSEAESNINSVLQFLDNQEDNIVIAIDEFQQILKYPEKNTDAWLRTRIQQLKKTVFIFSGSQQHLINELFTNPQKPFYRSSLMMKLEKIDKEIYIKFIIDTFKKHKKEMSPEIANAILEWTNTHTFYVQQLCNRVFSYSGKKVTEAGWKEQAYLILREQEQVFFNYRNLLTKSQWQLLKAIAAEGVVYKPTSNDFISKYNLSSSASVLRSLKSLIGYEQVFSEFNQEGMPFYSVYDVFFQRWAESQNR